MTQDIIAADDGAQERYRAPALDKGLDILELLSEQPGGLTRAEIVKAMGRGPSEIYRMLERLVARDYVSRSPEGDRYALTMKLFVLAHRHPPIRRLVARAFPLMDGFARQAGQSCHLVALDRDAGIVVAQASSPGNWEFGIRIGAPIELLRTGSGQTLLAFMAASTLDELAERWGDGSGAEALQALGPDLARYRAAGHRMAPSQQLVGVTDISVPILDLDGHALAVLTCPYIVRVEQQDSIPPDQALAGLKSVADRLSMR